MSACRNDAIVTGEGRQARHIAASVKDN